MRLAERWRYCAVHTESIQTCVIDVAVIRFYAQFNDIMRSYILQFGIFHWEIL